MNWILILSGALLCLAPFISGYSGQPGLLWFSLISGLVIIVLGFFKAYRWAAIASAAVFVAPWIFGFAATLAATWSWIIGAVVILLASYKGFIADRKKETPGNIQQHQA